MRGGFTVPKITSEVLTLDVRDRWTEAGDVRLRPNKEVGGWQLRARSTHRGEPVETLVPVINGLHDRNEKRGLGVGVFVLPIGAISLIGSIAQL